MITAQSFTRSFVQSLEFKPFTKMDWYAWGGCESAVPFIAEYENYVIIVDGSRICVYDLDNEEAMRYGECHIEGDVTNLK